MLRPGPLPPPLPASSQDAAKRDPEKDTLTIRTDIFKHASTVSSAVAAIYTTFLLTGLKERPPAFPALVISILCFFAVVFASVFALSNTASHIQEGRYELTRQIKVTLFVIYGFFLAAFISTAFFTGVNLSIIASKKTKDVPEEVKQYVKTYIDGVIQTLIQQNIKNTEEMKALSLQVDGKIKGIIDENSKMAQQYMKEIQELSLQVDSKIKGIIDENSKMAQQYMKEIQEFSLKVDNKLQKAIDDHEQQLRQYVDDKLKDILHSLSSSGCTSSP